jgi:hypothetical protein
MRSDKDKEEKHRHDQRYPSGHDVSGATSFVVTRCTASKPSTVRRLLGVRCWRASACISVLQEEIVMSKKGLLGSSGEEVCRKYICLSDRVDSLSKKQARERDLVGTSHIRNILLFLHARQPKPNAS